MGLVVKKGCLHKQRDFFSLQSTDIHLQDNEGNSHVV